MITVAILLNGQPLVARNAINQGRTNADGATEYLTDSGDTIYHHRGDGAVALAHQLLDTIRNDGPTRPSRDVEDMTGELSLLSLGKRVAGIHQRGDNMTRFDNDELVLWLGSFNGDIKPRFSSEIGLRLKEISKWLTCTDVTRRVISNFLMAWPQLLKPTQPTSRRVRKR